MPNNGAPVLRVISERMPPEVADWGGLCRDHPDPDLWHDPDQEGYRRELVDPRRVALAKEICAACPARARCAEWALTHDEVGIWGGLTEADRAAMKRRGER